MARLYMGPMAGDSALNPFSLGWVNERCRENGQVEKFRSEFTISCSNDSNFEFQVGDY